MGQNEVTVREKNRKMVQLMVQLGNPGGTCSWTQDSWLKRLYKTGRIRPKLSAFGFFNSIINFYKYKKLNTVPSELSQRQTLLYYMYKLLCYKWWCNGARFYLVQFKKKKNSSFQVKFLYNISSCCYFLVFADLSTIAYISEVRFISEFNRN